MADKVFELYPPTKGKKGDWDEESREDEDDARKDAGALDGEDWGGV